MVIGCAGPAPEVVPVASVTATTASWKAGEYLVTFRAGPGNYEKSYSNYEISRKFESDDHSESVAAESALVLGMFSSGYLKKPDDHIELFTSSSGKTLLIVEDVPNDCSPCQSWILVRGMDGVLVCDYLNVPVLLDDKIDEYEEYPQILRVTENEITYRFSNGKKGTAQVKDIVKKEKRPTFPG